MSDSMVEDFAYQLEEEWAKLPLGWSFQEVAAVAVDSGDRVYVFSRGEHPVIIFDRDGNFLRSWGEGEFLRPHGMHIGPDDAIYVTDDLLHVVRKYTPDGRMLLEIGVAGEPAPYMSGEPFHRCTHTALSPSGDIYVSDGYGNARVHKYSADGRLLFSWGEPGSDPGQFNIVHNICCDADGWVYVADRENHRVQVFDGSGRYEAQWNNLHRPCGLFMPAGRCPICYIGELGPALSVNRDVPNLGPRLTIVDHRGKRLARIGGLHAGLGRGEFIAPHGIAADSRGDIYVGEVSLTVWPSLFPDRPVPGQLRCLQKFRRTLPSLQNHPRQIS
jgi:DNA-binding beta-propeller fold protein YncE